MTNIIIAIIIQGGISAFFIGSKRTGQFFFLYLYLLVVCVDFLFELFLMQHFQGDVTYLDTLPGSFRLLKGPLILLCTQQLIGRPIGKTWTYILFLPFLCMFFFNIALILNFLSTFQYGETLIDAYRRSFSGYFYYWLGFLLISLVQLIRYGQRGQKYYSPYLLFLLYLAIGVLAYYIAHKMGGNATTLRSVYNYMFFIQFAMIVHLHWKSRQKDTKSTVLKEKYQHSVLTPEDISRIKENIIQYLEKHDDYIQENYTLEDLSEALAVPKHHLSQTVTEGLQTTFYELVNRYRLNMFLKKLHEQPDINIADLSYQVGFRSRTTFYKYFKSEHGLTPSEYKGKIKR